MNYPQPSNIEIQREPRGPQYMSVPGMKHAIEIKRVGIIGEVLAGADGVFYIETQDGPVTITLPQLYEGNTTARHLHVINKGTGQVIINGMSKILFGLKDNRSVTVKLTSSGWKIQSRFSVFWKKHYEVIRVIFISIVVFTVSAAALIIPQLFE